MDLQEMEWPSQSGAMSPGKPQQQRRTPRYPFVAPAAILPEAGAPTGGNVKELSLYGCYLDGATTLTARSRVLVKIFMPGEYFEANATVAYANPALGLGLVFRDVKPHFLAVLRKWLITAMRVSQATNSEVAEAQPAKTAGGAIKGRDSKGEPEARWFISALNGFVVVVKKR
jgi:hypothetical protein